MPKLVWDKDNERFYQTGVDQVALYVKDAGNYGTGIAWSGVSSIAESPSGAESNKIYADNIEYLNLVSAEELGLTITAYDSPAEFDQCDGTAEPVAGVSFGQQTRKEFGLAYKTRIGTNAEGDSHGYYIHLVYNCKAAPSERTYNTVAESPEALEFSWTISTTKAIVGTINGVEYKPLASIKIDSRKFTTPEGKAKLAALEATIWGGEGENANATLPSPAEVVAAFATNG